MDFYGLLPCVLTGRFYWFFLGKHCNEFPHSSVVKMQGRLPSDESFTLKSSNCSISAPGWERSFMMLPKKESWIVTVMCSTSAAKAIPAMQAVGMHSVTVYFRPGIAATSFVQLPWGRSCQGWQNGHVSLSQKVTVLSVLPQGPQDLQATSVASSTHLDRSACCHRDAMTASTA